VGRKAGQQGEHETAAGGSGIELLGEALDADATAFQFSHGFQGETGIAAETVEAIDQELIEAMEAGVGEDASTGRAKVKRHDARDAIIGVDGGDVELVEGTKAIGEFALGGDRLSLALFFGGNPEIKGDRHDTHVSLVREAKASSPGCRGSDFAALSKRPRL
jgi:hypothetical protein